MKDKQSRNMTLQNILPVKCYVLRTQFFKGCHLLGPFLKILLYIYQALHKAICSIPH